MTHTSAILRVSAPCFAEIGMLLRAAGYEHAFDTLHHSGDPTIDMHGIMLAPRPGLAGDTSIVVASILSGRTHEGKVELIVNGERAQLDLDKAREVQKNFSGAIEAAISDQIFFQLLTGKLGLSPEAASAAIEDLRELRQGNRGVQFSPS
jgi:hypothetical protein